MFAIGVGEAVNVNELLSIASSVNHTYTVSNYEALQKLKKDLAWKACQSTCLHLGEQVLMLYF